jgi:glutathione S-transferase
MLTLYDYLDSGNGYKIRLLLAQLGRPYLWHELDILRGGTRTPEFLRKNPNGRIPAIELEDGTCLAESDAILWYLAEGSTLLPPDPLQRAQVLQWMFFEQYSHEPYIAVARFWLAFAPKEELEKKRHLIPDWRTKGNAALGVMQTHLARHDWFAGGRYSIADIALYGYTHCAADGGFELDAYPAVRAWLKRVETEPDHIPLSEAW